MKKLIFPLLLTILLVSGAYYISTKKPSIEDGEKLDVIVSFYPLQEWAEKIGGEYVRVENITPAGAEPHDFEPSPKDIAKISDADVFIYNNIGLEPWADQIAPQLKNALNASANIDLLGTSHDHEDESEEEQFDPHVWLDPMRAKQQAENIADAFIKTDPGNESYYTQNLNELKKELDLLEQEFATLQACKNKTFITSHAAFQYLATKYGLEMITISGLNPEEEPSAKKLAEITNIAHDRNIRYIFFETLTENKFAETIIREIQGEALVLNPIEGFTPQELKDGRNYFSVQRENLRNLRIALQCNQ